jgi:hypothetical protein
MYNKRNKYVCIICKEAFRRKANYLKHIKYEHKIIEEKK